MSYITGSGMQLIAKNVLGSAAASVTFSSIPGNFNHLHIRLCAGGSNASNTVALNIALNGSVGNIHYRQNLQGTNATASAAYAGAVNISYLGEIPAANGVDGASGCGEYIIDILSYTLTTFNKMIISTGGFANSNAGQSFSFRNSGGFSSTAAITSMIFSAASGNLVAGSSFYLYGII